MVSPVIDHYWIDWLKTSMTQSQEWLEYRRKLIASIKVERRKFIWMSGSFICFTLFSLETLKGYKLHHLFRPYGQLSIFLALGLLVALGVQSTVCWVLLGIRKDLDNAKQNG